MLGNVPKLILAWKLNGDDEKNICEAAQGKQLKRRRRRRRRG